MKLVFYMIHAGLAALIAYQGYTMFYPQRAEKANARIAPDKAAAASQDSTRIPPQGTGPGRQMAAAVIQRNLFKVMVDPPGPGSSQDRGKIRPKPEKTRLKLTLWGTVEGMAPSDNWAVIEDRKRRRQDLYRVGDPVLGAQIKEISRNQVILTVDGKDQVLEAETRTAPGVPAKGGLKAVAPKPPPQAREAAGSPGDLIQTLRSRPFFREGTPSGVLIYGIRPGSHLLAMGLRNGDIIQTINGTEIRNSQDLKAAAQELPQEVSISLTRRGQEKEINYKGVEE